MDIFKERMNIASNASAERASPELSFFATNFTSGSKLLEPIGNRIGLPIDKVSSDGLSIVKIDYLPSVPIELG